MRLFYHATLEENTGSILALGLRPSADGYVYLAESIEDALKFLWYAQSKVMVFSVRISRQDEVNVEETYDHSKGLFECRAWGYRGVIPPSKLKPVCTFCSC